MKKAILLSGVALMLTASIAFAQGGLNMMLNNCPGGAGAAVAAPNNPCTSNSGIALSMFGSVVPPAGVDRMVAFEGYIDGQTSAAALSPWWTLDGCRSAALAFNADFTGGPFDCNDYFAGQATIVGGISPLHTQPNRFQIKFTAATVAEVPIDPGMEHYLFKVNILKTKSVSTGLCAGCSEGACLVLNRVLLNQPAGVGDYEITTPIVSNYVTYNGGAVGTGPHGSGCPGATPASNRTWGQVKSLYR